MSNDAPDRNRLSQEQYTCPFCNMGSGHTTRSYKRKSQSLRVSTEDGLTVSTAARPRTYIRTFRTPIAFDRHIQERHGRFFKRFNADEFYCGFCPCGTIANQPTCSATFSQARHFLQHLRSWHARCPEGLLHFSHLCAPISVQSYSSAVREIAEGMF